MPPVGHVVSKPIGSRHGSHVVNLASLPLAFAVPLPCLRCHIHINGFSMVAPQPAGASSGCTNVDKG